MARKQRDRRVSGPWNAGSQPRAAPILTGARYKGTFLWGRPTCMRPWSSDLTTARFVGLCQNSLASRAGRRSAPAPLPRINREWRKPPKRIDILGSPFQRELARNLSILAADSLTTCCRFRSMDCTTSLIVLPLAGSWRSQW